MSFILDALKKSEAERQRKGTPGVADIPDARIQPHGARWMWIVGALLAINLTMLAVLVIDDRNDPEATESISRSLKPPATAAQQSFSDIVAEVKEQHKETEPLPTRDSTSGEAVTIVSNKPVSDPAVSDKRATPAEPATSPETFDELRAKGSLQLPDLHIDLHVYSDDPAARFVMINMTRYTEGETLEEGPQIEAITPQGAILRYQGNEFLLPRQ